LFHTGRYSAAKMRLLIGLAGLCLLAASAAAGEPAVVIRGTAPGQILSAGASVELSWTGVPREASEVELLLSLDGGETIALRLTEQLASGSHSYLWRVPNLSSRRAAFILRMGIGGREIESAPSAPFQILSERRRPAESLDWHSGELWLGGEGQTREADPMPAAGLDSRPERWSPLHEHDDSIATAGATLAGTRTASRRVRIPCGASVDPPCVRPQRPPLLGPLRI
jgi:hypothetical protein